MFRTCLAAGALALALTLCARTAAAQVAPPSPPTPTAATFQDALAGGAPILEIRPRYEEVDQTRTKTIQDDAEAYTVRLRFGWRTGRWEGFDALVEGANVSVLGPQRFAVNVPGAASPPLNGVGKSIYPLINDPPTTTLNRAQLSWTPGRLFSATVGRQIIDIDDQRFVGDVNWRQNQQTFDAVRGDIHLGRFQLFVAYLGHVNRVLAAYRNFDSDSYLINARYRLSKALTVEAFDYLLDFGNSAINSSETRGLRGSGQSRVGPLGFVYDVTYARQSAYANAPQPYGLNFWAADVSATYAIFTTRLDYEKLDGDGRRGFTTPLATTHGFQGWADAFVSPGGNKSFVDGIEDYNLSLAIRPRLKAGPLSNPEFLVRAYDFKDQHYGSDIGREWDLSASVAVSRTTTLLLKYADFRRDASVARGAATPPPSRTKIWLMLDFKL